MGVTDLVLMAMVMDMDMDMVMDMAKVMVDIIMERDLLKILRHQWFMSYLKDLPMLDMVMDMAMVMVVIVTVMVTMVVCMAMDTMEVIISTAFISYYYSLYVVTRD